MKFVYSSEYTDGASKLARILDKLCQHHCEITVVGTMASKLVRQGKSSLSINIIENASVVWEFLKGRKLPGVMAVDRVCLDKPYFFIPISSSKYFSRIMQCMLKIFYFSTALHASWTFIVRMLPLEFREMAQFLEIILFIFIIWWTFSNKIKHGYLSPLFWMLRERKPIYMNDVP